MMRRRRFLFGALAAGVLPLEAQAAPLDLRDRVRAWRAAWRRERAARGAEFGLPAGEEASALGAGLTATAILADVESLEIEDQVHPAVQGLLRELADAVAHAGAVGSQALARWRAGPGRDDAEAMRLHRAMRRRSRSRWVDRDPFGVGRAGPATSVRRRVRRAERAASRLAQPSAAPTRVSSAVARRIEAGRVRHGLEATDEPHSPEEREEWESKWRDVAQVGATLLLVVGGVLCIAFGAAGLIVAYFLPEALLVSIGLLALGIYMLVVAVARMMRAASEPEDPLAPDAPDPRWGTLGEDPKPKVVALLPRPDFKPTGVELGHQTRVVVAPIGDLAGGTLHARIGDVELVLPSSGCLPRGATGSLSLRLDAPPTLEPLPVMVRLAEGTECPRR